MSTNENENENETDGEGRRAKGSSWRNVYETLKDDILAFRLNPGDAMDETAIAERFALSRSPVREALIRLSADELVITLPNRSTIVAPLEIERFPKYVEALDVAQRVNARLAAQLATEADIDRLKQRQREFEAAVARSDHMAMSEANMNFHMAIAQAGRNPYLAGFYERLLNHGRRILHLHFRYLERSGEAFLLTGEHDEMIEAIQQRNIERADALAHDHTRQFQDNFIAFIKENYTSKIIFEPLVLG